MSDAPALDAFVQLSALLTGFSADLLRPAPDPSELAPTYYAFMGERLGPTRDALVQTYASMAGGVAVADMTPEQKTDIGTQILHAQDGQIGEAAQALMKLWYLGSWYQPFDYGDYKALPFDPGYVVNPLAYTQGLAWQVMQSHAMGDSNWLFGYWTEEPPPLDVFTGSPSPSYS